MNLLEALGGLNPTITANTLGQICDQLSVIATPRWPHDKVRDAIKDLYKFASDYPGFATAAPLPAPVG